MSILITNIKELLQVRDTKISKVSGSEMKVLPTLKNAYLLIDYDTIVDYGKTRMTKAMAKSTSLLKTGASGMMTRGK